MDINLRFGMHRDVQTIHEARDLDLINGLVVPAHILAYQAAATGVFVSSLPDRPYVIDPMTYIWQNPIESLTNDEGELRPSIERLCEEVGAGLIDVVADADEIGPTDLPDAAELTDAYLEFQLRAVKDGLDHSNARKYLTRYAETEHTLPRALVPPYFRFRRVGDPWYQLSLECSTHALEKWKHSKAPTMPIICCGTAALANGDDDKIVADYEAAERLMVWLDGYSERSVQSTEIAGVRRFLRKLSKGAERPIEVLYGGYLFLLSAQDGIQAVSHGILYTQSRSYVRGPGSGGVPERYYIPEVHQFRSLSQADLIVHKHPELLCNCAVCEKYIQGNPDNIIRYADEPELLRLHFLTVRRAEADTVDNLDLAKEAERLMGTFETYDESFRALPNPDALRSGGRMRGLGYLRQWANSFG